MAISSDKLDMRSLKMNIMLKIWIWIVMSFSLISCSSLHPEKAVDFNQRVKLVPGKARIIGTDDEISIKVTSVNDNRCPKGVQCVWEGYVQVQFVLTSSEHQEASFSLCLGKCEVINSSAKLNVVLAVKTYEVTLLEVGAEKEVILTVRKI